MTSLNWFYNPVHVGAETKGQFVLQFLVNFINEMLKMGWNNPKKQISN